MVVDSDKHVIVLMKICLRKSVQKIFLEEEFQVVARNNKYNYLHVHDAFHTFKTFRNTNYILLTVSIYSKT